MPRRNLTAARQHAETCNGIETCAPEVQSRYLRDAIARCRLPIHVQITDWHDLGVHFQFSVETLDLEPFGADDIVRTVTPDWRDATRAYFALVATLLESPPAAISPDVAKTSLSAGYSAGTASPDPVSAISSPSVS